MITTARSGYLDNFDFDLKQLKDNKGDFTVVSSGLTRKIIFQEEYDEAPFKRLYFGNSNKDNLPGVHMVSAVRKNIDSYIEKGGKIPKLKYMPKLILYNFEQINRISLENQSSESKESTYAIDINACFFKTAYNLGYFTEELYSKAWKRRKDWKFGLLASIGSLNKHETIDTYKEGVLVDSDINSEYIDTYSPFYWSVINYVAEVMMEIAHELGDDFYMWLTDCVYLNEDRKESIEKILDKHNYEYKDFYIQFNDLDEKMVKWYDFKSKEDKFINHNIFLNYDPSYTPFKKQE